MIHTNPIFQKLELLKVQDVIKSQQLKLAFDFQQKRLPDDLMDLFHLTADLQTTNLALNSTRFFFIRKLGFDLLIKTFLSKP